MLVGEHVRNVVDDQRFRQCIECGTARISRIDAMHIDETRELMRGQPPREIAADAMPCVGRCRANDEIAIGGHVRDAVRGNFGVRSPVASIEHAQREPGGDTKHAAK